MITTSEERISKAKAIESFLKLIEECESEYNLAFKLVGNEDKKLQDILHEMEFAPDKLTRNRIATKLHNSRVNRRKNKDIVTHNEEIVKFFRDQQNKNTLLKMKDLLTRQQKKEEYLNGDRQYRIRQEESMETNTTKLNGFYRIKNTDR